MEREDGMFIVEVQRFRDQATAYELAESLEENKGISTYVRKEVE